MKILFCSIAILILLTSCENKEQQTSGAKADADSANVSPSVSGPVAEIKAPVTKRDTVRPGRKDFVLRDVQAQYLDSSTKIGKAGDLLLTFIGQGFIFTEHNPAVILRDKRYDDTYSNEDGSELYVIIPAAETGRFAAAVRDSIRVVNPGNQTAALKQDGKEIMSKASKAGKTGLIFTTYGVTRRRS